MKRTIRFIRHNYRINHLSGEQKDGLWHLMTRYCGKMATLKRRQRNWEESNGHLHHVQPGVLGRRNVRFVLRGRAFTILRRHNSQFTKSFMKRHRVHVTSHYCSFCHNNTSFEYKHNSNCGEFKNTTLPLFRNWQTCLFVYMKNDREIVHITSYKRFKSIQHVIFFKRRQVGEKTYKCSMCRDRLQVGTIKCVLC